MWKHELGVCTNKVCRKSELCGRGQNYGQMWRKSVICTTPLHPTPTTPTPHHLHCITHPTPPHITPHHPPHLTHTLQEHTDMSVVLSEVTVPNPNPSFSSIMANKLDEVTPSIQYCFINWFHNEIGFSLFCTSCAMIIVPSFIMIIVPCAMIIVP